MSKPLLAKDLRCSQQIHTQGTFMSTHQCHSRGTISERGKLWCSRHAPSAMQERQDKRLVGWQAKWDAQAEADAAPARKIAALQAQNRDLLAALERFVAPQSVDCECEPDEIDGNLDQCQWCQARAAITQAEGEEDD